MDTTPIFAWQRGGRDNATYRGGGHNVDVSVGRDDANAVAQAVASGSAVLVLDNTK